MSQVSVDEVALREPNLLFPGKKPIGQVKLDHNHPLTEKLTAIKLCGIHDLIGDEGISRWTKSGFSASVVHGATCSNMVLTTDYFTRLQALPATEWTMFCIASVKVQFAGGRTLMGFAEAPGSSTYDRQFRFNTTTNEWIIYVYDGTSRSVISTTPCSENKIQAVVATMDSNKLLSIHVRDIYPSISSLDSPTGLTCTNYGYTGYSTPELVIGNSSNSHVDTIPVRVYMGGFSDRAWSQSEASSWTLDPYQFLIPA